MGLYLGKQRIIAINEKVATKQWVTDQGYLSNTNLSDYVTNDELQPVSTKVDDVSAKVEDISTNVIKKGTLGTINGQSIENGNNVTIDLTLFKVVDSLPVSDIDANKIYLLPNPAGTDNNTYIEYMYINDRWEVVGEYKSDLSLDSYYTREQTDEKFLTKAEAGNLADYVKNDELDTKVGEAGYVKIDALTSYAKKTDIPTVPTKLSELVNDSSFITTYTETDPVWTSEKSNYYTKTEIDGKNYLTEHQSLADYVKTEALTTTLTSYAKKTDIPTVPTKLSELVNDSSFITTYTETDPVWTSEKVNYYTKDEINGKVATKQWVTDQGYLTNSVLNAYATIFDVNNVSDMVDLVSKDVEDISTKIIKKGTLGTINGKSIENGNNITIDLTLFKVVDQLPTTDIDANKIYLLSNPAGADNNTYIEYMYINGRWEVVGEYKAELSLDNYYTKGQTDEKFLTKAEAGNLADYVKNGELDAKVGEAGYVKTEALTTTLTSYAKKTDIPSVPTKLSELTNDSGFITTYTETDPVWTSEKSNYYTKTEIDGKNYLTEHQSLADYAKKSEIPTDYVHTAELADYATKTYVTEQIGSINSVLETI